MMVKNSKILIDSRLLAILLVGFASGLPLTLTSSTLQAWFTQANINIVTIGALSLLGIPYTLKFLWAPVMDHFGWALLGKRRGWMILTQAGVAISLLVLANLDPSVSASQMGMVALIVAFFSASQDIAVDAYRTDVLPANERGLGAAYYVFAYRIAMLLAGGLALVFADYWGWRFTYDGMALLMFLSLALTCFVPNAPEPAREAQPLYATFVRSLMDLLQRDQILLVVGFIVLYKFGDALALSLMTNFLLHGLGFTLTEVGLAYKAVSFVATVLGAFLGGLLLVRWSIFRALLVFGVAQAFSNLMFVWLALAGKQFFLMALAIFVENFCSGMSTAALMAFMMSLCDHRYTAGQYAVLSAVASLGRVFLGPVAGWMVESLGWVEFYLWSVVLCLPGLLCLVFLRGKTGEYAVVANE